MARQTKHKRGIRGYPMRKSEFLRGTRFGYLPSYKYPPSGMKLVPTPRFLRENFLSRSQVRRLLRERVLLGFKKDNKMYVQWCQPDNKEYFLELISKGII